MQWGYGSYGEVEIEETDGSSSGQKEYDFPVLFSLKQMALKYRRNFPPGHSVLGRRRLDGKVAS